MTTASQKDLYDVVVVGGGAAGVGVAIALKHAGICLLYTSPSPRDRG